MIAKVFYDIMKKVLMMKGKNMNRYFKITLLLALPLAFLLGCSKQASTPANSSSKEDTTTQSSETKQSTEQSSEKKETAKTHTFVNTSNPGITSTLVYTVEGDNVTKQTAQNVADPEILGATPEEVKSTLEDTYKGYYGLKGVKQTIEIKDGKVVQDLEVDFSVASISELRKALPEEFSGIGNRVSFSNSKKSLEKMGFTEKTN